MDDPSTKKSRKSKIVVGLVLAFIVLSTAYSYRKNLVFIVNPGYALKNMTEQELLSVNDGCLRTRDSDCLIITYKRLNEIDPLNEIYEANLAMELTKAKKYDEASPIYENLLKKGFGTYDLMAYYAMNFEGLGRIDDAIKWYEKTLEIAPDLIDITKKLAQAYVQTQRVFEALSLLKSFADSYPEAEASMAGRISANMELIENASKVDVKSLQLPGIGKGHFNVPISFKAGSKPQLFLVDTGASTVTLPTKDAEIYFPELMRNAQPASALIADGRKIATYLVTVPSLKVGPWELKSVKVVYCDSCQRLAGMTLLKSFKMETSARGSFYTLTISR